MNFAVNYLRTLPKSNLDAADEIILPYSANMDWSHLKQYITKDKSITFISDIGEIDEKDYHLPHDLPYFKNAVGHMKVQTLGCFQLKIKFTKTYWIDNPEFQPIMDWLKTNPDVLWFVSQVCKTWAELYRLIKIGVDEVYIDGELAMSLPTVRRICDKENIAVRVYPNMGHSFTSLPHDDWYENDICRTFFVRPEDVVEYEEMIETMEFIDGDGVRLGELHDTYRRGYYTGYLNDIINSFEDYSVQIPNQLIPPLFGSIRKTCHQTCFKEGQCNQCVRNIRIALNRDEVKKIIMDDLIEEKEWLETQKELENDNTEEFIQRLNEYNRKVKLPSTLYDVMPQELQASGIRILTPGEREAVTILREDLLGTLPEENNNEE